MFAISRLCGIEKDKSIVLNLARTQVIEGAICVHLTPRQFLQIKDFELFPVYVITEGKLSSQVQSFQFGTFINEEIYQRPLLVQQVSTVYKLPLLIAQKFLEQMNLYYEEFNCILQSIFKIEMNISDKNCMQLITCNENTLLTEDNKIGKYFYILIEGSCNVKKTFKLEKKEDVSLDLYSFKNYYLLGEQALFSQPYSQKITCTSYCFFLKINVEKFSRFVPISSYVQFQMEYRSKIQKINSTQVRGKSQHKSKGMNAQDIIQYYERANQMNNRKGQGVSKNRYNYHNTNILDKFCQKSQTLSTDYMNYFIESTEQKIRFQLISKGYKKAEVRQKVSTSLSQDQIKKMLRKRVLNQLKTKGKNRKLFQSLISSKSKLHKKLI